MNAPEIRELARSTDTELAALHGTADKHLYRIESAIERMHLVLQSDYHYVGRRKVWNRSDVDVVEAARTADVSAWDRLSLDRSLQSYDEETAELERIRTRIMELNNIYDQHRWARFFVVPGGHIHSSMHCSTCNHRGSATRFGWLPDLSAMTEKDAVDEHGALLCTVCFPSAPVEWTNFYEEQAAARAAARCSGSGTSDFNSGARRLYVTCNGCSGRVRLTSHGVMRAHKPAAA